MRGYTLLQFVTYFQQFELSAELCRSKPTFMNWEKLGILDLSINWEKLCPNLRISIESKMGTSQKTRMVLF